VPILVEILKVAALAALVGMLASLIVAPFTACILGVAALWLLLVKAS
jgi:hypothetical protein